MSFVIKPRAGRPPIVPPPPETPDVIFGAKLQFWFRAGDWTLSGSDITAMDNLEGTAARDSLGRSNEPPATPGLTPPQAVTEDGVDAIEFQGGVPGGYFQWDGQAAALTEGEMFIVHKAENDPQLIRADTGLHHVYDSTGTSRATFTLDSSGLILEAFGFDSSAGHVSAGTSGGSWTITDMHLYDVLINSSGNLSLFFNGNNLHYSDAIARTVNFSNGAMKWGRTQSGGGANWRWAGHGFELIMINTLATTTEKNKLNLYLANRYPALPALASF